MQERRAVGVEDRGEGLLVAAPQGCDHGGLIVERRQQVNRVH